MTSPLCYYICRYFYKSMQLYLGERGKFKQMVGKNISLLSLGSLIRQTRLPIRHCLGKTKILPSCIMPGTETCWRGLCWSVSSFVGSSLCCSPRFPHPFIWWSSSATWVFKIPPYQEVKCANACEFAVLKFVFSAVYITVISACSCLL